MIPMDKLKEGTWYDGFEWYDDKQKCVGCYQWRFDDLFHTKTGRVLKHRDDPTAGRVYTFDPNVESIGEPAS